MTIIKAVQKAAKPVSVLESLERQGVRIESQCRSGFCGACATRLLKGQVKYINEPLAFVRQGYVLPCACMQVSEELELDI